MLIDRLRTATFKGVEFLVEDSSISFGQKTVTNQYPNADRTEVEFLGQAEDVFNLEIYINSIEDDYIGKRNLLKQILSSEGAGLLVHPYEGEIRCSVVDRVTLVENDRALGIARFSVAFQKTSLYLYPTSALDNITKIRNLYIQLKNAYKNKVIDEYFFEEIIPENFVKIKQQLTGLYDEFVIIKSIVPINKDKEVDYNVSIEEFNDNINSSTTDAQVLADSLDNVIENLDNLAVNQIDNVNIYTPLYDFGKQKIIIPEVTVQAKITNNNYALITNYINVLMLGLSYNAISLVEFITDEDLNFYENFLEQQYLYVLENLDSDIAPVLDQLRNEIYKFFDVQKVRRVIEKEIPQTNLGALCYLLYDNFDDYELLYRLNNREAPYLYEGTKKVLTIA